LNGQLSDRGLGLQDFRQAMGRFCSGVTAITAATDLGIHGMTATAFSSLSLEPPLILSCVANHARMHGVLAQVRTFGVSILAEEQRALSAHFAGRELRGEIAFEWRQGVPVVSGALAQFVSTITARRREGDHTIYVGKVTGCWLGNGEPLLYYAGGYRKMGAPS
jgi:flavin reductase (DIM6/NTAB) family NADH-FMN oxidoreductase RutF